MQHFKRQLFVVRKTQNYRPKQCFLRFNIDFFWLVRKTVLPSKVDYVGSQDSQSCVAGKCKRHLGSIKPVF